MLDREREKQASDGFSSLWQERYNSGSHRTSWFNLVTEQEVFEVPNEAKGAILADDVCHTAFGKSSLYA
jgi:SWI/SNF-related matrix-associated actin-dependent regulator of chromatin subfamily A3